MRLSFIVPFHRGLESLSRCLAALDARPPGSELIVAADGARDDCRPLAAAHGARVVEVDGPSGPAVARNAAAGIADGDVLVFVDADVVVSEAALARLPRLFVEGPGTAAVFGTYDEHPADRGFVSQYKNLSHAFIHRSSSPKARTFWAGFGAVRREAFRSVGGFDEGFERPSVEDIDLGYRLTRAGYEVTLDATLTACHLKRWTLGSTIASDVRDRGVPWTQLILRYGAMADDLNLSVEHRWSIVLAYAALAAAVLAEFDSRLALGALAALVALTLVNRRYYGFLYRMRGGSFAARAWLLHALHHLYNGLSFAAGAALFATARYGGIRLPGALPVDPWTAAHGRPLAGLTPRAGGRILYAPPRVDTAAAD